MAGFVSILRTPTEAELAGKPDEFGHVTRYSDSSLYDEVCVLCGATDARGDDRLERKCPNAKIPPEKEDAHDKPEHDQ